MGTANAQALEQEGPWHREEAAEGQCGVRQGRPALARRGGFEAEVRRRVTGEGETGKCVGINEAGNASVGGPRGKPTLSGEAESSESSGPGVQKGEDEAWK